MSTKGATKEIRQLGDDLLKALDTPGKVEYFLIRAPVGTKDGAAVPREIEIATFTL